MLRSTAALATLAIAAILTIAAPAAAGTVDAPELTDAAGDCQFAFGNEYADIVSAWVSDETATHFTVNVALAKWTADQLGAGMGVTVQFEHQGKQFGVAAIYAPPPMGGGWEYSNGYVNLENGDASDFEDAEGSFTPGTPALLAIKFDKNHFPHGDSTDNALRGFQGASVDFKGYFPFFPVGGPPVPPPFFLCDEASGDGVYTFKVGGHSTHDMGGAGAAAGNATADANGTADPANGSGDVEPLASAEGGGNETPGPGLALALGAGALATLARRRRA